MTNAMRTLVTELRNANLSEGDGIIFDSLFEVYDRADSDYHWQRGSGTTLWKAEVALLSFYNKVKYNR